MKTPKRRRGDLHELCAHTGEGDGIGPRDDHRVDHQSDVPRFEYSNARIDRKMLRLCRQVQRAVELSPACCGDPLRFNVRTVSSRPVAGGTGIELLVHGSGGLDPSRVAAALAQARTLFCADVARSITRRRVPNLSLRLRSPTH